MTVYHWLTLPGGYTLPVALVETVTVHHATNSTELPAEQAEAFLLSATQNQARGDMIAGEILEQHTRVSRSGGVYQLTGFYTCREMVARSVPAILWESEGTT